MALRSSLQSWALVCPWNIQGGKWNFTLKEVWEGTLENIWTCWVFLLWCTAGQSHWTLAGLDIQVSLSGLTMLISVPSRMTQAEAVRISVPFFSGNWWLGAYPGCSDMPWSWQAGQPSFLGKQRHYSFYKAQEYLVCRQTNGLKPSSPFSQEDILTMQVLKNFWGCLLYSLLPNTLLELDTSSQASSWFHSFGPTTLLLQDQLPKHILQTLLLGF